MPERFCVICDGPVKSIQYRELIVHKCCACGHQSSALDPALNQLSETNLAVDLDLKRSLRDVRLSVLTAILDDMAADGFDFKGSSHLDIGCSTGDFLELATKIGMKSVGVEPEHKFAQVAKRRNLSVHLGVFPSNDLTFDEKFDLISFMDVMGHIPDCRDALRSAKGLLSSSRNSRILLKTPVSEGIFFKLATSMLWLNIDCFWRRIWQVDFASPQIHYFSRKSLKVFAARCGMSITIRSRRAISFKGLWGRLEPSFPHSIAIRGLVYGLLVVIFPLLIALPSDSVSAELKRFSDA